MSRCKQAGECSNASWCKWQGECWKDAVGRPVSAVDQQTTIARINLHNAIQRAWERHSMAIALDFACLRRSLLRRMRRDYVFGSKR